MNANAIVGGKSETGYYSAGWMHVWYKNQTTGETTYGLCSATLISKHALLTSADCLSQWGVPVAVYFGTDTSAPVVSAQGDYAALKNVYQASDWNYNGDIGLVFFENEINMPGDAYVLPVIDAALDSSDVHLSGLAIGYGRSVCLFDRTQGTKHSTLLAISSVDEDTFTWNYDKNGYGSAGDGDSGGAVVYVDPTKGPIIMGVILGVGESAGSDLCRGETIASNVGAYRGWIEDEMELHHNGVQFLPVP